ncbi:MAG: hypothetical protein IJS56_02380 [Bacilli bacterium]|nr:hypothetical protein [Bacilli bacterium]
MICIISKNMVHLCRKLFSKIFEENGKLFSILKEHFDYNKNLYNDLINSDAIIDFYNYIMLFYGKEIEEKKS